VIDTTAPGRPSRPTATRRGATMIETPCGAMGAHTPGTAASVASNGPADAA
jgi:hypothetical protein